MKTNNSKFRTVILLTVTLFSSALWADDSCTPPPGTVEKSVILYRVLEKLSDFGICQISVQDEPWGKNCSQDQYWRAFYINLNLDGDHPLSIHAPVSISRQTASGQISGSLNVTPTQVHYEWWGSWTSPRQNGYGFYINTKPTGEVVSIEGYFVKPGLIFHRRFGYFSCDL